MRFLFLESHRSSVHKYKTISELVLKWIGDCSMSIVVIICADNNARPFLW